MALTKIKSYKSNFKKCKDVLLADNIFFSSYERWNGGEVGTDIIKGILPADEKKALQICNNGITINNIDYIAYTSTPSMQKKEVGTEKCEMFFIKKDKADFIQYFEDLISLGTIKQFDNKKICINKKITSRIALAMSSTYKIDYIPKIAVVPNKEIEVLQDVIYYTSKDNQLIEHKEDNKPIKLTQHDGFGLMNDNVAEAIKDSLKLNYRVDYAVIRLYGLAVKGLCLRFDWMDYIKNYCDNQFIVKDVWGNDVDLSKVDMILTETQCKWWENFADIEDYYNKLNNCADKDLVNCLYVTKTNKKRTKEYSLTNYQLMSNLTLDFNDFMELAKPTIDLYKGVINGDLASIKYFLKEFDNEEGEIIPQQKVEYLLNANDDFIKSSMVKQTINKAILKSVCQLSSGKMYLKGNYKIMIPNPFLLIDNLLNIDRTTLKENEFYIPNNNNKQFTISRNPLASCWEIANIKTVSNELFDKYFKNYTDEIIIFNNVDWTHNQLSYADFDADGVLCIENSILYDNVISDNRKFIHVAEGETVEMEYNTANKFLAIIKSSGNLIGQLAINGGKISNKCLYGSKQDMINNFYANRDKLLYLTELQMEVIDAPKSLKLPTKEEMDVLDIRQSKPLFLTYKDGYYKKHKTKNYNSHYEQFAQYIIDNLLNPYLVNIKQQGMDLLSNYIFTQDLDIDNNCLSDVENLKNEANKETGRSRKDVETYKTVLFKYQLKAIDITKKYGYFPILNTTDKFIINHRQICNCLVKLKVSDKFIINYFWNELVIKLNELEPTAKVLSKDKDGEYEFFGNRYNLTESKLIEDNLQDKEIKKKMKRYETKGKQGVIGIGKCDVDSLKGDLKVIVNAQKIDLYKDDTKITYAFKDIKDTHKKKTTDTLFECSIINIVDVLKETDKSMQVLINY